MTTIAWDGKTLAADRKTSSDGAAYRYDTKIMEIPGGYVACCGNVPQVHRFVRWLRSGRAEAIEIDTDALGALMIVSGELTLWDGSLPTPCRIDEKIAIGSGTSWALAALDFGKTAAEAVAYAATRDNGTGGGVDTVSPPINQPRRKPARKG